jgi:cation diffusion facilitator family transporter
MVVLIISIILLAIKFTAWYITRSNAILTDALESIVNVVAGSFALFSIYYASLPSDENHPYGHGKVEFLSSGFEGGLIFIAGMAIIANSVWAFFLPPKLQQVETGVWLSAATGAVNFIMGKYLVSRGKKTHSLLMTANGKHLISDTVSSIGLVAGLFLIILTGKLWLDNLIAIIFGLIILITGFGLLKKSVTSLLDEADEEKLVLLVTELNKHRQEKWIDIHNLRVIKYGPNLHVDCHITLPWYDSLEESHSEVDAVEKLVRKSLGRNVEFFIHADPCIMPKSCTVCQLTNCSYRKVPMQKKVEWELSNMLPNKKHGLNEKDGSLEFSV